MRRGLLAPAEAAHALAGIVSWLARQYSDEEMRAACVALANYDAAWTSSLAKLPHCGGVIPQAVALLAVVCRGLIEITGVESLRAALSFWATETDPSEWQRLFAA